ncbi:alpha/beta fold hydrolase [Nocardia sp. IBHARD005]|uniref:alpha/beta fold hydrolase n=1 Tax=Nocardia sp. IBHARD005 TaxID=3457765 RepID=UPI0040597484
MVTAAIFREIPLLGELENFVPPTGFPPITTVWGRRNRVLSARAGATLNRALKPSRAIVVDGAGHLVMVEAPEQVTAAVLAAATGMRVVDSWPGRTAVAVERGPPTATCGYSGRCSPVNRTCRCAPLVWLIWTDRTLRYAA